jgi:hypothetical protein
MRHGGESNSPANWAAVDHYNNNYKLPQGMWAKLMIFTTTVGMNIVSMVALLLH